MKTFAEILNSYCRPGSGFSRRALSIAIGKSRSYLEASARGETPPPKDVCEKIADVLGLKGDSRHEFLEAAARERRHCDTWYSDDFQVRRGVAENAAPYNAKKWEDVIVFETLARDPIPGETVLVQFLKDNREMTLMEFVGVIGEKILLRDVNKSQAHPDEYPLDAVAIGPITGKVLLKRHRNKK